MKKALFVISFLIIFSLKSKAQYVTIPDARFVTYLQAIGIAMIGNQMDTTNSVVTTLTNISVASYSISDLTGVQYFDSLESLNCAGNQLTSLPKLPNSLTALFCYGNQITSLPSLPGTLTSVDCRLNQIINLPALPNTLKYLDCSYNQVSSLPALPDSLKDLACNNNQLISLPALPDSLKSLTCSYNLLTSLPTLPNLYLLECNNNQITCFPTFPNSIGKYPVGGGLPPPPPFEILNNSFTCLPNYITAMDSTTRTYPLCATGNTNGCAISGIEHLNRCQLRVYPNPVNANFVIETNTFEIQNLQIFDVTGKMALSRNISGKTNIDASNLDSGIYFIQVRTSENISTQKIIVQH